MKNFPDIFNAIVLLTNQCPMACVYCFETRTPERMTYETAQQVLKFLSTNKEKRRIGFTFFGGEPLLEYDTIIYPLVNYAKKNYSNRVRFAMTTNGVLLNEERIKFLAENNIRFMLSIDGNAESQSKNRPMKDGRNSFDLIMKNIPIILKYFPDQKFRSTLSQYNVNSLFKDILFFEKIGAKRLMIVPDFFIPWKKEKLNILCKEIKKYENYIIQSFQQNKVPLIIHEYHKAFQYLNHLQIYETKRIDFNYANCIGCHKCGIGTGGSVSINPKGEIYGCHHISPLVKDSLFYLGDVYQGIDEKRVEKLAEIVCQKKITGINCGNCELKRVCNGGCIPNNYQINKDFGEVPPMFCFWNKIIFNSAKKIVKILGNENNILFIEHFCKILEKRL